MPVPPDETTPRDETPLAVEAKKPPAKPDATAAPAIGLLAAPKFTALDFDTALEEAVKSLAGDNLSGKINEQAYPKFCKLAEVLAYTPAGKVPAAQRQNTRELLDQLAKDPQQVAEIGRLAGETVKKGEFAGGLLLAGRAATMADRNGLYACNIALAGSGDAVTVMSDKPLGFQSNDRVLIAGGMIAEPAKNLAGYGGSRPMVV